MSAARAGDKRGEKDGDACAYEEQEFNAGV